MVELYKNIKKLREEKGMSQDSLAKLTGYTDRSSITKIEKGQVDLQQSKIELFAEALGTSARDLMGWNDIFSDVNSILSTKISKDYKMIQLATDYYKLNDIGQQEATKRVEELTYISKYTDSDYLLPIAAHTDDTSPENISAMETEFDDFDELP